MSCKKYYEKNKNKRNKSSREYNAANKDKIQSYITNYKLENKEKIKKYYEDNREELLLKMKKYREDNKDDLKDKKYEYYQINKDKRKEYYEKNKDRRKEYLEINKDKSRERDREYVKNKSSIDPLYRLKRNMRACILTTLKKREIGKINKTEEIIGCSFIKLREHIENQWEPWMNWSNYGMYNGDYKCGWDIDHLIELKTAKTEEELLNLNHYTNLRPLDTKINRVDRNIKLLK